MRTRHPFADVPLEFESNGAAEPSGHIPVSAAAPAVHPDAVEKGVEFPLGFMPFRGENRQQRRAAVAQWAPPKTNGAAERTPSADVHSQNSAAPAERMPTRRELLKQRQRARKGTLDVELRRIQRKAIIR